MLPTLSTLLNTGFLFVGSVSIKEEGHENMISNSINMTAGIIFHSFCIAAAAGALLLERLFDMLHNAMLCFGILKAYCQMI